MRRSKHMAKRAKGLKILKIIIILAITFLAGIIVTFCQKQSKPVVTDENRTTQTTSSKPKRHKKAEDKKENGKDTKVSDTNKATAKTENSTNESDKIEQAKKALDKYCKGEYITGEEAKLVDWYCRTYNISPQPEGDWWEDNYEYQGQTKYDDEEPKEEGNDSGKEDVPYNAGENYGNDGNVVTSTQGEESVATNTQQGSGNYGNN